MSGHTDAVLAKLQRPIPSWVRPFLLACILAGAVTFAALILRGHAARAWSIYLVNWLDWTGLSMGLVLFGAVTTVAKGKWALGLRRVGEASVVFLPVSFVLFLVLWFGRADIFPWVNHPITDIPSKAFWLRPGFMWARDAAALLLLFGLSGWFVRHSLRLDGGLLGSRVSAKGKPMYDRLLKDWNTPGRGAEFSWERREQIAPMLLVAYALCMSLIAFDLIMSIAPHWVSNLLGGYFFMGAWLSGLMALGLLMMLAREYYGLEEWLTFRMQHDVAKLCFGFTVFWAYLFFSQFLVIWYGNMPEETSFVFLRMATPTWRLISTIMVVMCFLLPFIGLMGIKPKRTPAIFKTFAIISLTGLWLDRYVLVVPSVVQSAPSLPLGWQEILMTAGFFGLWGLCYLWFIERFGVLSPAAIERAAEHH